MKKYIEAIIEIVLDNVSCLHHVEEEYPRGPKQDEVNYGLVNEQDVIKKCLKLKPEPKVAEDWIAGEPYWPETPESRKEWIDKKAEEFLLNFPVTYTWQYESQLKIVKDFIRSLFIR